jgi:hypothetical protein
MVADPSGLGRARLAAVVALLDADELVLETVERPVAQLAAYRLVTPSGALLGAVREHGTPLRSLNRLLGARRSPKAHFDVVDADGSHLLDVEKDKVGVRGRLRLSVALANGTAVGSVEGTVRAGRPDLVLYDQAGSVVGKFRGDVRRRELTDAGGGPSGTVTRRLMHDGPLPAGVARAYDVVFDPSAGVAVRGLTLAAAVSIDMPLF